MNQRTCKMCSQPIPESKPKQARYCSPRCSSKAHVDGTKPCTVDGCERKTRARGLCASHYNTKYQPNRHPKKLVPCAWCGSEVLTTGGGGRKYGTACSTECRSYLARPWCKLPADHWARWYGKSSPWRQPVERIPAAMRIIECEWCGAEHQTYQTSARYCGRPCARRAGKMRRRGKEAAAPGEYAWAQVMRLHLLASKRCSYCDEHVSQPEPDHVVPISRGGRNDIGNILPCCQQCNGDKGDMTLIEWAAYRERRGKAPVRTQFDWREPRFTHLVHGQATGESRRIKSEAGRAA